MNLLGYIGAEAAYRDDSSWHAELIVTLRINRQLLADAFASSRLRITFPEATYLAWIDARAIHPTNPLPVFEAHGVGLSDGADFGFPGWVRINFGCPTATLQQALQRSCWWGKLWTNKPVRDEWLLLGLSGQSKPLCR